MKTVLVQTHSRTEFVDITPHVRDAVREAGITRGICTVFCPHTTAGITINENADPDVVIDLLNGLERIAPYRANWRHSEGNSDAHLKSSLVGCSTQVLVEDGAPVLGTWQSVYFCEFDGPRHRQVHIQALGLDA